MIKFIHSNLRALHLSGSDAVDFMQSQVTLDVASIPEGQFFPAAWCDAKGRVLIVMLLARRQDHVMAVVPESLIEITARRMNLFRIGRKLEISSAQRIHAAVKADASKLENDWYRLNFDASRAIHMTPEPPDEEQHRHDSSADSSWQQTDLDCGFPWLSPETSGHFIPQMLDLERLQGLSYHKGCYPGQEVIARVHYRGKVTRKTMRFEIATDTAIQAGDEWMLGEQKGVVLYALNTANPSDESIRQNQDGSSNMHGLMVVPTATPNAQLIESNGGNGRLIAF